MGGDWTCWAHPNAYVYYGLVTSGPSESQLRKVRVTYTVPSSSADQADAMTLFEALAGLPYTGSDSAAAIEWMQESWDQAHGTHLVQTDIGPGHFVLHLVDDEEGADCSMDLVPEGRFFD